MGQEVSVFFRGAIQNDKMGTCTQKNLNFKYLNSNGSPVGYNVSSRQRPDCWRLVPEYLRMKRGGGGRGGGVREGGEVS